MTTAKSSDDGKRGRDGEDPGSFSETEVKKCQYEKNVPVPCSSFSSSFKAGCGSRSRRSSRTPAGLNNTLGGLNESWSVAL